MVYTFDASRKQQQGSIMFLSGALAIVHFTLRQPDGVVRNCSSGATVARHLSAVVHRTVLSPIGRDGETTIH
jgi:hypothetical protein